MIVRSDFAVACVMQDQTLLWRHGVGNEDLPEHLRPPVEVDHRHVRTGQNDHGHDTAHRYPEYLETIAEALRGFEVILIIGHGHGKAAFASIFLDYLHRKHPDIYGRVVDNLNLNLPAMSEAEIRGSARQWYEKNFGKLATWHNRKPTKWFT